MAEQAEHDKLLAMHFSQTLSYVMPEVRTHSPTAGAAFVSLSGTGHRDCYSQRLPIGPEEEQAIHGVVFVPFQSTKIGLVGSAVHLSRPVGICGPPVLGNDRMPQPPRKAP